MGQDEDHLLNEIGRLARQQDAEERRHFDERWRRLADGTISEEDDAALRARAAESEEARLDYEALRPLGADFHDRILERWQARPRDHAPERPEPRTPSVAGMRRPPLARRGRRPRLYGWLSLAAVLALAVVGWRLMRGPSERLSDLPRYTHELDGDVREMRSSEEPAGVPVFVSGGTFRLVLRPDQPLEEFLEPRFYLESSDREVRLWPVDFTRTSVGGFVIEATVGEDLAVGPGDWTLLFVYGRPGRLPDLEKRANAVPTDDWKVYRVPFRIESGPLSSTPPRLEVEVAGCLAFFPERACLPQAEVPLTLWVRVPPAARLELWVGDALLDAPGVEVEGGRRFSFLPAPEDREVVVRLSAPEAEATWRLGLIEDGRPDWLKEANRLLMAGQPAAGLNLLENHLEGVRSGGATSDTVAVAQGILARFYLLLGRPEEEVLAHLDRAIELHRQQGDLFNLARDIALAIYLDYRRQKLPRALARVDELARALPRDAPYEARFHLVHSRAILERRLGRFREALELANREITLAGRMGDTRKLPLAREEMALVLQDLGRFGEAHELLRGLESAYEREPCSQSRVLNNRAWVLIQAADPGLGDPLPLLARALEIAQREPCGRVRILHVILDQARAFVESERTWEGIRALENAEAFRDDATPDQRLWWEQVEGLLALQDGRALDALERFERLEDLALGSLLPEGEWLAKLGQAKAHQLLDATPAALAALREADDLLDKHSLQVPLHEGRGRFMAQRGEGTRLHLELLLRAGRPEEALDVARRSRSRLLRDLTQSRRLARFSAGEQTAWSREIAVYLRLRDEIEAEAADDWRLTGEGLEKALERRAVRRDEAHRALDNAFRVLDRRRAPVEPRPLRSGETVLLYHPLTEGWVGFAAAPGRIETHRFELPAGALPPADELARRLLEPFREILKAADRVRILSYGRLIEVDVHALPWAGDVLLAAFPVAYGLDAAGEPEARSPRRALVVADPRGDLSAAEEEGEEVVAALGSPAGAWDVVHLPGEAATPARIRDLAAEVDLLHYAGHGVFKGPFGWESSLLLAGESRFALGDVLSLDRAPATVVLSSCESARAGGDGAAPSLGLAQAFLVAGSQRVVAAVRPVGDRATGDFFRELYREWLRSPSADLAESLRTALLAWRQRDPAADWQSFRLLEL